MDPVRRPGVVLLDPEIEVSPQRGRREHLTAELAFSVFDGLGRVVGCCSHRLVHSHCLGQVVENRNHPGWDSEGQLQALTV